MRQIKTLSTKAETNMVFLGSEKDLKLDNGVLYFYSSSNLLFQMNGIILDHLKKFDDVVCIDISNFKSMIKRFDIITTPTVVHYKNNKEVRRIEGLQHISEVSQILEPVEKVTETK